MIPLLQIGKPMDITWRMLPKSMKLSKIKRSTDQTYLVEIAQEEPDLELRLAAVDQITDFELLTRLLSSCRDDDVSLRVVERLQSAADILYVINCAKSREARFAALARITDQSALAKIAADDGYWAPIREAALERVEDQSVLYEVYKKEDQIRGQQVRRKALECMTGQEELGKVALYGMPFEREIAYRHLTDELIIANALRYEYDLNIQKIGLSKINQDELRKEVALYYRLCQLLSRCNSNGTYTLYYTDSIYVKGYSQSEKKFLRENMKLIEEMATGCPNYSEKNAAQSFLKHDLDKIGLKNTETATGQH